MAKSKGWTEGRGTRLTKGKTVNESEEEKAVNKWNDELWPETMWYNVGPVPEAERMERAFREGFRVGQLSGYNHPMNTPYRNETHRQGFDAGAGASYRDGFNAGAESAQTPVLCTMDKPTPPSIRSLETRLDVVVAEVNRQAKVLSNAVSMVSFVELRLRVEKLENAVAEATPRVGMLSVGDRLAIIEEALHRNGIKVKV